MRGGEGGRGEGEKGRGVLKGKEDDFEEQIKEVLCFFF